MLEKTISVSRSMACRSVAVQLHHGLAGSPAVVRALLAVAFVSGQHRPASMVIPSTSRACSHCPVKLPHHRLGARVRQHPFHLRRQVFAQFPPRGQAKQFVVRHGGPQKVGEPRGQRVFIHQRVSFLG